VGFGRIRVTIAATKILSANPQRQSLILTNSSSSGICFLGPDNTVTSCNAATLLDSYGSLAEDSGGTRMFLGDVYGITTSANAAVNIFYWERV
jgi:hypothetical protein